MDVQAPQPQPLPGQPGGLVQAATAPATATSFQSITNNQVTPVCTQTHMHVVTHSSAQHVSCHLGLLPQRFSSFCARCLCFFNSPLCVSHANSCLRVQPGTEVRSETQGRPQPLTQALAEQTQLPQLQVIGGGTPSATPVALPAANNNAPAAQAGSGGSALPGFPASNPNQLVWVGLGGNGKSGNSR